MPLLFSYGTLREAGVQRALFGRELAGQPDELVGFERRVVEVRDAAFVAASGRAQHAIVRFTGHEDHRVAGIALELTEQELEHADHYEPAGYRRVRARLASGREAWVYSAARDDEARGA